MNARERFLDVSELEPPEPLERVLTALEYLEEGQYLHMAHRREPLLLYPELEQRGFDYLTLFDRDYPCEVLIWRRDDRLAETACRDIAERPGR